VITNGTTDNNNDNETKRKTAMNDTYIMGAEARSIERQNAENLRRWEEEEKKDQARLQEAKREWEATPDSARLCIVCGLKLSPVDIGRITEKPTLMRQHEFCNPFKIASHVVQGLVNLLREAYGDDPIPLESLRRLVETWLNQAGQCYISNIAMSFAIDDKPPTPVKRRQKQKQWEQSQRHAALHSPTLWFDEDGDLHLLSKTVAGWKGDLKDQEFTDLVRTLFDRLPQLEKKQIMSFTTPTHTSAVHRRARGRY
jgi:hypothetical protein